MAAAKKKASSAKSSSTSSTSSASSQPTAAARAQDVAPIEQPAKTAERNPSDESALTPGIDPSLSSDNRHSSYQPTSEEFPPDQGNQVEEVPGQPKAVKD